MSLPARKQNPLSLYLVDDSAVVRQTLSSLLSLTPGVEICGEAESVALALAGVTETKPDVILLDLNLPGGTGLDVLQAVRIAVPEAVVIVLTMHSFHDLGSRCLEAGAHHFFEKTGELDPLLKVVAGLAWRKNPEADPQAAGASAEFSRQKARTHEVLFREVTESSVECITVLDLEGHVLWVNQMGHAAMGLSPKAVSARPRWADFFEGVHRRMAQAALATAKQAGLARLAAFCATLDGTPKWWEIVVTSINGDEGKPAKFLVVSRDVTVRRAAVAELGRQLDQLEADAALAEVANPRAVVKARAARRESR